MIPSENSYISDSGLSIAIVGGGAAGTAVLYNLVELINGQMNITLFEPSRIGPGLAYSDDVDSNIANRPTSRMFILNNNRAATYLNWLQCHPEYERIYQPYLISHGLGRSFIPRKCFGFYLNDLYKKARTQAINKNISVNIIPDIVFDIEKIGHPKYIIRTKEGTRFFFDIIVICTGHSLPMDIFGLLGYPKYIHSPWPIKNILPRISKNSRVGIIGSRLTAIDISLALGNQGNCKTIHMLSPSGKLPIVGVFFRDTKLKHLTKRKVDKLCSKHNGHISLKHIQMLLDQDLKDINSTYSLHKILRNQSIFSLPPDMAAILAATNEIVPYCWNKMRQSEKNVFLEKYHRVWLAKRVAIPGENYQKIDKLLKGKKLFVHRDLRDIKRAESGKFVAHFDDQESLMLDYVINATGSSKRVEDFPFLIQNMVRNGYAKKHPNGGIEVDFHTCSVIGKDGIASPELKTIGHPTCGTFYYTSTIDFIAYQAEKVSRDLLPIIQAKTAFNRTVDSPAMY